jgi:hypothetical protein
MTLLIAAYALISAAALALTLAEAGSKAKSNPGWRFLGVLACLVWPVTLAVMIVSIRRQIALARPTRRGTSMQAALVS